MNDSERFPEELKTEWLGRARRGYDVVGSTNDALWEWALSSDAAPHGASVVASAQSSGKGRQGRPWTSPRGSLYVSVLLRPRIPLAQCAAWPLVVGLTLAEALEEAAPIFGLGLKWPNDVQHEGRKLAGILLESRSDPAALVVGTGVNLKTPNRGWGELEDQAVALDALGAFLSPAQVMAAWWPRLESAWIRFEAEGFPAFREAFTARSVLEGRTVHWTGAPEGRGVQVLGVEDDGALRVLDAKGEQRCVHAGEVHLGGDA